MLNKRINTSFHARRFDHCVRGIVRAALCAAAIGVAGGCATAPAPQRRVVETTAYCPCAQCCKWQRGSSCPLSPAFYQKERLSRDGHPRPYSGKTASGTRPHEPRPGLFSLDSLDRPWVLPFRLVFPWLWFPRDGAVAADTAYYPFGTRLKIEGYGWGRVEDRGSAIRGPDRLDLFFESHSKALRWGRRKVAIEWQGRAIQPSGGAGAPPPSLPSHSKMGNTPAPARGR